MKGRGPVCDPPSCSLGELRPSRSPELVQDQARISISFPQSRACSSRTTLQVVTINRNMVQETGFSSNQKTSLGVSDRQHTSHDAHLLRLDQVRRRAHCESSATVRALTSRNRRDRRSSTVIYSFEAGMQVSFHPSVPLSGLVRPASRFQGTAAETLCDEPSAVRPQHCIPWNK